MLTVLVLFAPSCRHTPLLSNHCTVTPACPCTVRISQECFIISSMHLCISPLFCRSSQYSSVSEMLREFIARFLLCSFAATSSCCHLSFFSATLDYPLYLRRFRPFYHSSLEPSASLSLYSSIYPSVGSLDPLITTFSFLQRSMNMSSRVSNTLSIPLLVHLFINSPVWKKLHFTVFPPHRPPILQMLYFSIFLLSQYSVPPFLRLSDAPSLHLYVFWLICLFVTLSSTALFFRTSVFQFIFYHVSTSIRLSAARTPLFRSSPIMFLHSFVPRSIVLWSLRTFVLPFYSFFVSTCPVSHSIVPPSHSVIVSLFIRLSISLSLRHFNFPSHRKSHYEWFAFSKIIILAVLQIDRH